MRVDHRDWARGVSSDEQRDRAEQHRLEPASTAGAHGQQISVAARRRQHGSGFAFDQFATHRQVRSLLAMTDREIDDALRVGSIELRCPHRRAGDAWSLPCVNDQQLGTVAFRLGDGPVQRCCGSVGTVDTDHDPTQMWPRTRTTITGHDFAAPPRDRADGQRSALGRCPMPLTRGSRCGLRTVRDVVPPIESASCHISWCRSTHPQRHRPHHRLACGPLDRRRPDP